jgi:hypothetical protein
MNQTVQYNHPAETHTMVTEERLIVGYTMRGQVAGSKEGVIMSYAVNDHFQ